ncbi:MAG: hypothetical protein WAU24_10120 [Chitinophagaceae bacterium]
MTALFSNLPARQKFLLILTLSIGLLIWFCSVTNIASYDTINTVIFFYSFGVPFLFLGFSTIMDLNDNKVFLIWFTFSIILLLISFATKNSSQFIIHRSAQFDKSSGINSLMTDHSTAAMKSLFLFLIVYWILNQLSKKVTGNFIVNTYRQKTWINEDAKRKMTGMDVLCNIILFATVLCSVLF